MLESAARSVNKIGDKIEESAQYSDPTDVLLIGRIKRTDAEKLQNEYEKLVAGLQEANEHREDEDMLASPGKLSSVAGTVSSRAVLSKDMVDEAMPGNIRKAEHFIAFLRRFIEYLKVRPAVHVSQSR
jgi:DNA excision repair protein ERCC-2